MPPAASSALSGAAQRLHRQVSRLDAATASKMFPREQRLQWPQGYLPASGIAHLLSPDGIPFHEVLECYMDIKQDRQHELQRDFASDYALWNRCALEDFVRSLGSHHKRRFTRLTARDRLGQDGELREVFRLPPYTPPPPPLPGDVKQQQRGASAQHVAASPASPPRPTRPQDQQQTPAYYEFQPYAATQEFAMLPVRDIRSPQQRVRFGTFPQIRNVLHTDFDSMTALRALSLYCDDAIVLTRELVQSIALYVQRRLEELAQAEPSFLAAEGQGRATTTTTALSPVAAGTPTYSTETPVVVFFGNGRLAWMLNESGLLPKSVRAVQLPRQAAQRQRRQSHLLQQQSALEKDWAFHNAFSTIFPCETLSVGDALRKYAPAIAIVEPHVDRDYLSDLRGYFSVREVLCMGQIDSPAMASFAFPFLSFGATPGPTTYWAYNDNLHKVTASARIQMPMDAPYVSQGYERDYVDDISAYLISPNDCPAIANQYRAVAFRRVRPPLLKAETMARQQQQQQQQQPVGATAAAAEGAGPNAADGAEKATPPSPLS